MAEHRRLTELYQYHILDTNPETELDQLTEIASLVCETPMSLITMVGKDRTWHKSKYGIDIDEVNRKDSFCQHVVTSPNEIMIVEDAQLDQRFSDNPYTKGENGIRFYAGAPLVSENGFVLGSLCVVDTKPRKLTDTQKRVLEILSKKAMDYLNLRRLVLLQDKSIKINALKLTNITNMVPCIIYQLRFSKKGNMNIDFLSEGINSGLPSFDPAVFIKSPEMFYKYIYPDDLPQVKQSIEEAFLNTTEWNIVYRVKITKNKTQWHLNKAMPQRGKGGIVTWYGTIQNISSQIEYEKDIKQILFDISHVLRKPVTNLLGLINIMQNEEISKINSEDYIQHLKSVTDELDMFTRKLTQIYSQKNKKIAAKNIKLLLSEKSKKTSRL